MIVHLPTYLGGTPVELEGKIDSDEEIVGWIDEYGTITSSRSHTIIGDVIQVANREMAALVLKNDRNIR